MEDLSKRTALADQKPLPDLASTPTDSASDGSPSRRLPRDTVMGTTDEPEDMNVDSSDADADHADHADHNDGTVAGSDTESPNPDEPKSGKKKRTQRFYCTDYPPCNLSFTRSEHLARHIRKHTGERPFQCHCSRRFSRLDNLRQHAQTVHVNEDIPIDSLAASGTRFQRQIRAERVRQPGSVRARPSSSSLVVPMRGHSKALSTSSLASNSSVGSTMYPTARDDMRHRPPPLVMADPRARTPVMEISYRAAQDIYMPQSPEYATPVSATYSNAPLSPQWEDRVVSPSSARSRPHSMYATLRGSGSGRRLSVPSAGGSLFQSPPTASRGPFSHGGPVSYSAPTGNDIGGPLASPTSSTSTWSRRESVSSTADADWRRRTWHPDSREFPGANGGGVSSPPPAPRLSHGMTSSQYSKTPLPSMPIANPSAQTTGLRLPGIESFDPLRRYRPSTPPSQVISSMAVDSDSPLRSAAFEPSSEPRHTPSAHQRDLSLHRGLTRLEIDSASSPRNSAGAWADDVNRAAQAQAEQSAARGDTRQVSVRFEGDNRTAQLPFGSPEARPSSSVYAQGHQHTASAPSFSSATSRQQRRQAWYNGPRVDQRVERMVHPNLANGFSGFPARVPQTVHEHQSSLTPEPQQQPPPPQQLQQPHYQDHGRDRRDETPGISRLDALVAAAAQASTAAY